MLYYFRKSFPKQILLLFLATAIASCFHFLAEVQPRLRFTSEMLLRGVFGAAIVVVILALLHLILLLVLGKYHENEVTNRDENVSVLQNFGAGLALAISQEFVLRAYLFSTLLLLSPALAYLVNAVASFLLHFRGRSFLGIAALKAVEGSIYALMYANNRSIAMVVLAHLIVDNVISYLLTNTNKSWISHALSFRKQQFTSRILRQQSRSDS